MALPTVERQTIDSVAVHMRTVENEHFQFLRRHQGQTVTDTVFQDCAFDEGAILEPDWDNPSLELRPLIQNCVFRNCRITHPELQGAIIEDVCVDGTKGGLGGTQLPTFFRGNAYKHVVLRGRIVPTEIVGKLFPSLWLSVSERKRLCREWDSANATYYETVDWALDITHASYAELSISGIPTRLIRRDTETSAVVTLESAQEGGWRDLSVGFYDVILQELTEDKYPDVLLLACPRSKNFAEQMEHLRLLRGAGVAQ
jgi:hypothetical protein